MPNNTINNHCLICGKGYYVCHSCREVRTFSPWRSITDTANCFKIYRVLSDYNGKCITKEQASRRKKTPVVETVSAAEAAEPVEDVAPETEAVAEAVAEGDVDICE